MLRVLIIAIALLATCFSALCQGQPQNESTSKPIDIYNEILTTRNPNTVIEIVNKLKIEEVAEDSLKSYLYYYKGSAYGQLSKFDSALYFMDKASEVLPKDEHPMIEIQILRAYGNINWAKSFYHIALEYYEKALDISYKLNNAEFQISLLGNIAGIYNKLENLPLALEYALKSEEISDKTGVIRPRSHMKIGNYQNGLGEYEAALKSLDKTRRLILKEGKDSIALGVNYVNIATTHLFLKNYDLAKKHLDSAEVILNKFGYKYQGLYLQKIEHALGTNNLTGAQKLIEQAAPLFTKQQDLQEVKSLKLLAKELAMKKGNLKEAIQLQDEIYALNDTIKNTNMVNRVYELQTQYETARKEAEIEKLKLENNLKELSLAKARNQTIGLFIIGIMLLAIVAVYFTQRNKKLHAEKLQQEFQLDALRKRIVEIQAGDAIYEELEVDTINEKINTPLTERELEALKLVMQGKANKEIADTLFVSIHTVKFHLSNIYQKLGVANKKEALEYVVKSS
ncbi:helix-turn-helix domain-containing protein [Fulvivirga lutea]|uniref:HTH luxR-type domain-containing protein n=1 Tax=Fulvivirga lutea TaxID=2810512 RepID=A0A974WIV5_9BACT|nr:helix-turn-helix transcriptional regulator [Fulvivirga lutea]QSE99256.1 hypothetical protein JR347_09250 [Fulvivirga lutea]